MLHEGKRYQINNNIVSKKTGEDVTLVLKEDLGDLLSLNETGGIIFDLIKEDLEKEQMICKLLTEYNVEEELVKVEVDEFIDRLINLEILI